ncbi:MAG: helix-turn-helix domain-containing protein [Halobaculum sp.]
MPEARRKLETIAENDSAPTPGSHKASVLALLARDPDVGYEPKEIAAETPVPQSSVYKVLQRLREDGLIEKLSGHYLVNPDRIGEIEEMVLTTEQFEVVASVSDRDTAPEEVDAATPEEMEVPDDELLSE